jgi:hypothetical protein
MSGVLRRWLSQLGLSRKKSSSGLSPHELKVGGLYSVANGDESRTFGVVKILVLELPTVHIRVYQNSFATRPETVDLAALTLNGLDLNALNNMDLDNYKFGIGHMPLFVDDFLYGWQPLFIMQTAVTEDELRGYNYWKEEGGGVFGGLNPR